MTDQLSLSVLDLAAELARRGEHGAALQLLGAIEAPPLSSEARELQAIILAQQGRYAEARESYRDVLAAEPDRAKSVRGMRHTERILAGGSLLARAWGTLCRYSPALYAALALLIAVSVCTAYSAAKGAATIFQASAAADAPPRDSTDDLVLRVTRLEAQLQERLEQLAAQLAQEKASDRRPLELPSP
jgi:hypothetical protein